MINQYYFFFFFFQAEDGIRDHCVTGVQTCALPISFSEIKAVFFPRPASDEGIEPAAGSEIAVEFADGEIIKGTAHYNPERNGFYLYPLDRSKNDRIFVVNSAIGSIEVERR